MEEQPIAQGVQQLIDRLHEEGVKSGKEEAQKILLDSKKEASKILDSAKREAERILKDAHEKIESDQKSAREMLQIASRDAILTLREQLLMQFEHHIKKIVSVQMGDTEFIKKLILSVGEHALSEEEAENLEVLIGTNAFAKEEAEGFIEGLLAEEFAKGVEFSFYEGSGILLKTKGEEVVIDLSEDAVSQLVFRLLTPRYRAIFEGVGE